MLTKDVIGAVAAKMGCVKKDARELLLDHFRNVLIDAARKGEKVHLARLGTFYPARSRKPMANGMRRTVLKFKPAKPLLAEINASEEGEAR
ncbi:MAG: DNA-binding protein HU-beta [Bacillota bacterium]|nr:DNA-binding protein HU-beta [Bacillota bacterium]